MRYDKPYLRLEAEFAFKQCRDRPSSSLTLPSREYFSTNALLAHRNIQVFKDLFSTFEARGSEYLAPLSTEKIFSTQM
jgi:hypothetical protein